MVGTRLIERIRRAPLGPRSCVVVAALCVALFATALGASTAEAARGLRTGFTDNFLFDASSPHPSGRELWLERAKSARAGIIRLTVDWRQTTRNKPTHPANPADPAYGFGRLDAAVRSVKRKGLDVLLSVHRAPPWFEGAHPPRGIKPGAWKPNPVAYGQFGKALARRYSGHFQDLPRVRYFEVWSEPNLTQFLAPQWKRKRAFAPKRYRQLLNHLYAGVHKVQRKATVIAGATSPFGDPRKHQLYPGHPRMQPMVFLRTVLCLNHKLRRARKCKPKPHLDAVSTHPINLEHGPRYKSHDKNDSQVANFSRVRKMVKRAKRAKTIRPKGRKQLWVTESGFLSNPPNPNGVRPKKHARWVAEGIYLLWKQGASVVLNLNLRDPAYDPKHVPSGQWTTGIYFHSGLPKPALKAFKFPFVTHRKSAKTVKAWGTAPVGGKVQIQQKRHGQWRTRKRFNVGPGQVFNKSIRVRGRATLRARVGTTTSNLSPESR